MGCLTVEVIVFFFFCKYSSHLVLQLSLQVMMGISWAYHSYATLCWHIIFIVLLTKTLYCLIQLRRKEAFGVMTSLTSFLLLPYCTPFNNTVLKIGFKKGGMEQMFATHTSRFWLGKINSESNHSQLAELASNQSLASSCQSKSYTSRSKPVFISQGTSDWQCEFCMCVGVSFWRWSMQLLICYRHALFQNNRWVMAVLPTMPETEPLFCSSTFIELTENEAYLYP